MPVEIQAIQQAYKYALAPTPRQARMFADTAEVSGVVLTKLDGTARGGIALAIARELAVALGGRIDLRSEPGLGSRFTVVLPASAV